MTIIADQTDPMKSNHNAYSQRKLEPPAPLSPGAVSAPVHMCLDDSGRVKADRPAFIAPAKKSRRALRQEKEAEEADPQDWDSPGRET